MDPANEAGAIPGLEVLQKPPEGSPPTWVHWGQFSPGATPPVPSVAGAGSPVVRGFGGCWFWGLLVWARGCVGSAPPVLYPCCFVPLPALGSVGPLCAQQCRGAALLSSWSHCCSKWRNSESLPEFVHQGGVWTPPGCPARRGEQPWGRFGMGFPGCSAHLAASRSVSDAPGLPEPPACPPAAWGITGTRGEASP